MSSLIADLAGNLVLGALLSDLRSRFGDYELLAHWTQGEFHHDVVIRVETKGALPGDILVISTNCNGGVKELLGLQEPPDRGGLWRLRCPQNPEFVGALPAPLQSATTVHWFEPCELLVAEARSELREEFRERQVGGGWKCKSRSS